jgi:inosine-uridine nucleoside N-ribohydrolase
MVRNYRSDTPDTGMEFVPKKIILDCDPGIDDALAIIYAVGSAELELLGITTVAGNVSLAKTTTNALRVCEFIQAADVPVTPGCAGPLLRPPLSAEHVHGADGLGGCSLPAPGTHPQPGHAADFIIENVLATPGEVTLVAVGPLTNIALTLRREPRLATAVRDFVIMGGSSGPGNVTPAAEFNIAADPEAAAIVFSAGWTVTMVGLDVTRQARADREVMARLGTLGQLADVLLVPCLRGYADGGSSGNLPPAVHDLCAVAQAAHPGLLGCRPARVEVETAGRWTSGMTVTDFRAPASDCNALVAATIDLRAFWDTVMETYSAVAQSVTTAAGQTATGLDQPVPGRER